MRAAREVLRVLPRLNEDVNEEWIADKTPLRHRRPDAASGSTGPRCAATASCVEATWAEAFAAIADKLQRRRRRADRRPSPATCAMPKSMLALKDLMAALGSPNLDCRQDGARLDAVARDATSSTPTIAGIEQADASC